MPLQSRKLLFVSNNDEREIFFKFLPSVPPHSVWEAELLKIDNPKNAAGAKKKQIQSAILRGPCVGPEV